MNDFLALLKGEYCGTDTTSFKGVRYVIGKEYEFFFFKNSDNLLILSLDHLGHGEKHYNNLEDFFKEWKNVSSIE